MKKGFTLVEMTIVLIAIGIMVFMGSKYIRTAIEAKRSLELKDDAETAVQAVIDYTLLKGRLPTQWEFSTLYSDKNERHIFYTPDDNLTSDTFNPVDSVCKINNNTEPYAFTIKGVTAKTPDANKEMTFYELKNLIGCSLVKEPLLISVTLPKAYSYMKYQATIKAKGGQSQYRWCAQIDSKYGDPGGLIAANGGLFKNCREFSEWMQTEEGIDLIGFGVQKFISSNLNTQSIPIEFYVKDNNGVTAHKTLILNIESF